VTCNKTDRQDITEMLLKVALNAINQPANNKIWKFHEEHLSKAIEQLGNIQFLMFYNDIQAEVLIRRCIFFWE